jgi:hypothetical protein
MLRVRVATADSRVAAPLRWVLSYFAALLRDISYRRFVALRIAATFGIIVPHRSVLLSSAAERDCASYRRCVLEGRVLPLHSVPSNEVLPLRSVAVGLVMSRHAAL